MTLGIIMLAYCHLVEVLWIAIMSITMLCNLTSSNTRATKVKEYISKKKHM